MRATQTVRRPLAAARARSLSLSLAACVALAVPGAASAREYAVLARSDAATVELTREAATPVDVFLSTDQRLDKGDRRLATATRATSLAVPMPADRRDFVLLRDAAGKVHVAAERIMPLEHASNFRDVGGYETKDGHTVRWGHVYRSAAMPLLDTAEDRYITSLGIGTDVDLRSLDERSFNPDTFDDRDHMLFVSNDYAMAPLMKGFAAGGGENMYTGLEVSLAPQLRSFYTRILADDGAVLVHCSAGQDRTGVAIAMLLDVLGVDRPTIEADYQLSTKLRRTRWEMARFDPADFPGNPMAPIFAKAAGVDRKPDALYSKSGVSHLAQFFAHMDATYGSTEAYMEKVLDLTPAQIARLRAVMLR